MAALLLALVVIAGCGKSGAPPSDANDWTCQDWKNAGAVEGGALGDGAQAALTQLGNEVDASGRIPGSVSDKKARIQFYVAQICAKNPNARPAALAVSKTRRGQLKDAERAADRNPPPLDQSGQGSAGAGSTSSGGSTPSSSGQSPSGGGTGSGDSTPTPTETTPKTPEHDSGTGQAPTDTPCRPENPSPPPECFQH